MYDFIEEVGLRYSKRDAEQTQKFFGDLNLLVPQKEDYMLGKEHMLVFLNQFGVVLRIGDPLPCPEHDLVLKPFKKIQMEKAVFEVLPGIECGISMQDKDLARLRQVFTYEKYDFWDWDKTSNVGFLPTRAAPFAGRVPVVLDRGAIRAAADDSHPRIKQFREAGETMWRPVAFRGLQEQIFAPFNQAIQAAWPDSTHQINKDKMLDFWKLCRSEIQKRDATGVGVLCNKWEDNHGGEEYIKTIMARESSVQYIGRYAQFSPKN